MAGFLALGLMIGIIVGAVYYCIGAVLLVIGVHLGGGRVWELYGAWIGAVVLIVALALGGGASGYLQVGRNASNPYSAPANLSVQLTVPWQVTLTGGSECSMDSPGHIYGVNTLRYATNDWRFGDPTIAASITVGTSANSVSGVTVMLHLSYVPYGGDARYNSSDGGQVEAQVAADSTTGQVTFSHLPRSTVTEPSNGLHLPDAISGELHWSCQGDE